MNKFKSWFFSKIELFFCIAIFILSGSMIALSDNKPIGDPIYYQATEHTKILLFTGVSISIILALWISFLCWKNFEEIISRNLIWHNHALDHINMRLRFSIIIFIESLTIFMAMLFFALSIAQPL